MNKITVALAIVALSLTAQLTAQSPQDTDTSNPPQGGNQIAALFSRIGANPGVGYTPPEGSYACWQSGQDAGSYRMNLDARPWGPTGNGPLDSDAFNRRYLGGKQRLGGSIPCGMAAELWRPGNEAVLLAAYAGACPAVELSPEGRDGVPTIQELTDLAVVTARCGSTYRTCWHERRAGGSPERAIAATDRQMALAGWCEEGVRETQGPLCAWPVWYDVTLPPSPAWCEADPPDPAPECTPYQGSECETRCAEKDLDQSGCFALVDRFPSSKLAGVCKGVCREAPPEPAPPPPEVEKQCWRWEPDSAGVARSEFVPGLQSTGRLEVELLLDGEWVRAECPEGPQ